jgi:hypothetical protein
MKVINSTIILALILAALPAAAQVSYDWSHVGSVGIVQAGTGHVFTGPSIGSARTGTVTARYNVTNTVGGGIDKTPAWTTFAAAYTDSSASGVITLRLFQVDKCSNQETEICALASSDNGTECNTCTFGSSTFDFANNFYYIQANITQTSASAGVQLHTVAIN